MERLFEGSADAHGLTHGLHGYAQGVIRTGKFFKGESRDLDHAVINGGLKRGRGFPCNVVGNLIQGVTHSQLGGHLGNGEPGGLGCKRRGSGHPRIHLHHEHFPGLGAAGELDVRSSCLHTHLPDDINGSVPHGLVFLVRQGLGRSHGNAVPGVNAHGIHVLDGTDDDHIVHPVPHQLQLILLPSDHGLLNKHGVNPACFQAFFHNLFNRFHGIGNPAPCSPQRKTGPDDDGQADFTDDLPGFFKVFYIAAGRHLQSDSFHCGLEESAVLGLADRLRVCSDHLHPVGLQHAQFGQFHGHIQPCLSSHGGKQGIGPLLIDDLFNKFRQNRLDVGAVRNQGVGHDGRRIAVHEHDLIPFFLQGFTRLCAGIIKLTALSDHNGAGSQNQHLLDIVSARHNGLRKSIFFK